MSEKFCLKWNDFQSNVAVSLSELRAQNEFFDITLVCDENQQVAAHKVILAACSPFFRNILLKNSHHHPLLYLKGVKYSELVSVLNFMYQGEVNVAHDELNNFLAVADDLMIKGLSQNDDKTQPGVGGDRESAKNVNINQNSGGGSSAKKSASRQTCQPVASAVLQRPLGDTSSGYSSPMKRARHEESVENGSTGVESMQEEEEESDVPRVVCVKPEPLTLGLGPHHRPPPHQEEEGEGARGSRALVSVDTSQYTSQEEDYNSVIPYEDEYSELDDYEGMDGYSLAAGMSADSKDVNDVMAAVSVGGEEAWKCLICAKVCKRKYILKDHVVSLHFSEGGHECSYCGKNYKTRNSLQNHMSTYHKTY